MFAAILAALQAIPLIARGIQDLVNAFNKYQDAKWRDELNAISSKLSAPTTSEEKADAAKKLSDLISRL